MMGATDCVHYYRLTKAQGAAFQFHGNLKLIPVATRTDKNQTEARPCPWLIVDTQALTSFTLEVDASAWTQHATVRRPSDNNEDIVLFRALPISISAKP
jgi:hypothetical protein